MFRNLFIKGNFDIQPNVSVANTRAPCSSTSKEAYCALAYTWPQDGYCFKYDISLPLSVFYDSVTVMQVGWLLDVEEYEEVWRNG